MDRGAELGEFLRSRRAGLRPEDVGLVSYGARRRVPGLRREELAQLAGVSVAYYTRLEQGQSQNASDGVLEAIAKALRLDDDERAHLHDLARPRNTRPRRAPRPERVRAGLRRLVDAMDAVPVLVTGWRTEVLAWNRLGHALFAGHLDPDSPFRPTDRPSIARLTFLDPHTRELYADWKAKARESVAYLRLAAGRHPDDRQLTELVGELSLKSPEFAAMWSAQAVRDCASVVRDFHHPLVGALTLEQETADLTGDPGQRLVMLHAEPGSPSEAALRLLANLTADNVPLGRGHRAHS
ncbi:MAG: transcriptional regulator, family [Actinomycetia bacterium]|nr:transcriptional regulator, family [Actinomycetes bacterium]